MMLTPMEFEFCIVKGKQSWEMLPELAAKGKEGFVIKAVTQGHNVEGQQIWMVWMQRRIK